MSQVWESFTFSVDLVKLAQKQLEFLQYIDTAQLFYEQDLMKKALYRYEKIWLPMYASLVFTAKDVYPPMDVAWVWHYHLLSPTHYYNDCQKAFGRQLDHACCRMSTIKRKQTNTRDMWEKRSGCSFDYNRSNSVGDDFSQFRSKFASCDIMAACH
jgi:hypothetical protein